MHTDPALRRQLADLETQIAALRRQIDPSDGDRRHDVADAGPSTEDSAAPSRRRLFTLGAGAVAAGAVGAAALGGQRAAAATGDNMVLGQANEADTETRLRTTEAITDLNGPGPIALELQSDGGHLRFIGAPGDVSFGTYPAGTLVFNATDGLHMWHVDGTGGTQRILVQNANSAGALALLDPPARAYDSRLPGEDGSISSGELREVSLLGDEQIPENITGAMVNVTVTETAGFGWLTVYSAARTTTPDTSSVNWYQAGATIANQAVTAVSGGAIYVACGGVASSAQFIIDVVGVYGG